MTRPLLIAGVFFLLSVASLAGDVE